MTGLRLVCLLPARNCAHDLPGWFESVGRFADAVIALDDGSTDDTRAVLEEHPLVRRVLANPPRPHYRGWDDATNRARLLTAAAELSPSWILSLDADERIPADDAVALAKFLPEADRRCAYLMRVYHMIRDLGHFDAGNELWVGRLFPFEPGQEFPRVRFHLVTLPTSIPPARWLRTTIRIQHLAAMTAEVRRARYEKYAEVDADRRYQKSYEHLRRAPRDVRVWDPRPPSLPALVNGSRAEETAEDPGAPALSAIVISRDDETRIEAAVASVVGQQLPEPFEVIVVTSGTDRTAEIVRTRFPSVRLVELSRPALPGEARNAGLALARGRYVTFPGSHVELPPGSLAARLRAHRLGYAMVTTAVLNGTPTPAGWAAYFLDHASMLPGRPSGPLAEPPLSCSYLRTALQHVGGFPEGIRAGEDTLANSELFRRGYGAWRAQEVRFVHKTPCTTPGRLLKHAFGRGRGLATVLLAERRPRRTLLSRKTLRLLVGYVPGRLLWIERCVRRWADPELRRRWRRVAPLVALGIAVSWCGVWYELLRPGSGGWAGLCARGEPPPGR